MIFVKRGRKILIIGIGMEVFVLFSLASYHIFFSHTSYNSLLVAWGNLVHPILIVGIVVLLIGSVISYADRKKTQV